MGTLQGVSSGEVSGWLDWALEKGKEPCVKRSEFSMYFILKMSTCLLVTIGLFIYHKLCSFLVLIFVMKTAILDILALLLDTVNN